MAKGQRKKPDRYDDSRNGGISASGQAAIRVEPDRPLVDREQNVLRGDTIRCPVCAKPFPDYLCEHFVSTWSFGEAEGIWKGNNEIVTKLMKAVSELFDTVRKRYVRIPRKRLKQLLPAHLFPLIIEGCVEDWPWAGDFDGYFESLIQRSPTYAGSAYCESCSPGASCAWMTYWAVDVTACVRNVDEQLEKDIRAIRAAAETLQRTSAKG
jgi:hypothetical protein